MREQSKQLFFEVQPKVLLPGRFVLHRMPRLLVAVEMFCYRCNALTINGCLVVSGNNYMPSRGLVLCITHALFEGHGLWLQNNKTVQVEDEQEATEKKWRVFDATALVLQQDCIL